MTPLLYAYRAGRSLDDGDPRAQFAGSVVIDHGNTSYPVRRNHWNSHLDRHSTATPARAAFRFMGATTTWRQLHDLVCGLANAMARRGIGFDAEELGRLVAVADVVVQGMRPGTMERHSLGLSRIAELNPGCVYVSISAYAAAATSKTGRGST